MNPRTTLVLALVAAALGAFIWFYELGGEAARQAASDEELRIHPGLASEDVESVAFETNDGVAARFERTDGSWRMVAPTAGRADLAALDAVAAALTDLRREGRVETPGPLDEYGLGDSARVVRFEVAGKAHGLRIGKSTPIGGHRYVARLADDEVAYVSGFRLNALNRKLDDLRDRRIFHFAAGEVSALRIAWPGGSVALEREASDQWRMTEPIEGRADDVTVRELLSDLSYLRATGFVDEGVEALDPAALERAFEIRITLAADDDGEPRELTAWVGGSLDGDRLLSGSDGELYRIASERLEDLPRRIGAYRFKTLSEFEVADARRLRLRYSAEPAEATGSDGPAAAPAEIVIERSNGGWTSASAPVDPDAVSDLVRELARLRADDILADSMGEGELQSLGLSPPRAIVRIEGSTPEGEEAAPLAAIAFGRLDESRGLFAQQVGSPIVYVIAADRTETWPLSRVRFEERFVVSDEDGLRTSGEEIDLDGLGEDPLDGLEMP